MNDRLLLAALIAATGLSAAGASEPDAPMAPQEVIHLFNEAFGVFPSSGKILLQSEGSEVFFRRVELHPVGERLQ